MSDLNEQLAALKAAAEAATAGPWAYQEDSDAYTHIVRPVASPGWIIASATQTSKPEGEANGRFIAAANPATILALIAEVEAARRAPEAAPAPVAASDNVHELDAAMSLLRVARTVDTDKVSPAALRKQVAESVAIAEGAEGEGEEYIFADVYENLSSMMAPYVHSGEPDAMHPFPASVVDTFTILLEHYLAAAPAAAPVVQPVVYSLKFHGSPLPVNPETTFLTREKAEQYAHRCADPIPVVVPLYAAPSSTAEAKDAVRDPEQLLAIARHTGLRHHLHGVSATHARELLSKFVSELDARARAAIASSADEVKGGGGHAEPLVRCAANRDGECNHPRCPQLRDNEPTAMGRHCPLDARGNDDD